jgi:phosphatidylinositol glycan class B
MLKVIPKNWLVFAALIHIIAAWYSVGHYHDDEYHQILAFTSAKMGLADTSELRWEYQDQLRSAFQPFFAYSVVKALSFIGVDSPFIHAFILRLISGLLSIVAILLFIKTISPEFNNQYIKEKGIYYFIFLWLLVFLNVRFSSEGWAASLFILSLSLYLINASRSNYKNILIGFIFGLAFLSRYQVGLMLLGLGLWMIFINKENIKDIFFIIVGGIIALLFGIYCDFWLYNEFVLTTWNYLNVNLLQGRVEAFTHEPWWYYMYYSAVQILPPITLLLPLFILAFWWLYRKHPITWITIPFFLLHQYLGHKEMRFLFPILPFAPIIFALIADKIALIKQFNSNIILIKLMKVIFFIALIINSALLILVMFLPSSKETVMWEKCLSDIPEKPELVTILTPDIGELEMHFYNVKNINIVSSRQEIPVHEILEKHRHETIYYAARKIKHLDELEESKVNHEMVCQIVPNWLLKLNVNDWTSRASLWRLWKIKPE